jgi:GGDEF domain-containing protein
MSWLIDNTEAQTLNEDWTADRLRPPKPEQTGLLKASGLGIMRGGVALARGAGLAASVFVPHEDAPDDGTRIMPRKEDFFKFIETRLNDAEKFWTPDPESVGMAGQIVGAVSELPLQLAGGPGLMAVSAGLNAGEKLVEQGVDGRTAAVAGFGAGVTNALMMKLPQAGNGLLQTGGLIALNPLMGAGQDYALKKGLEAQGYDEQAKAIDPLNPVARIVDVALGGVFGAMGYHANRVTTKANASAYENVSKRVEEYQAIIKAAGGEKGIREVLPVEVVDSLDATSNYLKTLETNPFNREAIDGVDKHLAALKSALGSITEGKPVDVSATGEGIVKPAPRPLELQSLMDKWSARYGMTPDEENGLAALIQARASVMKMQPDEFVAKYFADVTNDAPGEAPLFQTVSAAEQLQRRHAGQTPEQQQREMFIDPHSGVYNSRAFQAAPDTGAVAVFGFDSLKFINDTVNHSLGNDAYKVAGQALKRAGDELDIPVYRVRGDYAARLPAGEEGQAQFAQLVQRANELRDTLDFPKVDSAGVHAGPYDAIQLRGAIGKDIDSAHQNFTAHKVELETGKQRPARDQKPWGMDKGTVAPRQTAHAEYSVSDKQRQHFDSLPEAERFAAVHIDPATGLYSHAAFQALEEAHNWQNDPNHVVSSVDVAGLGALNEISPALADQLIIRLGERIKQVSGDTVDAARMAERGDEFAVRGNSKDVEKSIKALAENLERDKIVLRLDDGTTLDYTAKVWSLTGRDYEHADTILGILKGYEKQLRTEGHFRDGRLGGLGESFERARRQSGVDNLTRENSSSVIDFIRQDATARGLDPQPYLDKIPAGTLAALDAAKAPAVLYQSRPIVPPFYSKLLREVSDLPQEKWNAHDLANKLHKTPGVKAEEIAWTGLDEFLAGKKSVTREEVRAFLEENQVKVEEVTKEREKAFTLQDLPKGYSVEELPNGKILVKTPGGIKEIYDSENDAEVMINYSAKRNGAGDTTRFSRYVLPGGENYRELLLRLPDGTFKGGHFEEKGILAHVRYNEHRTIDGENVLHAEEVQSDWHQKGRDKGYKSPEKEAALLEEARPHLMRFFNGKGDMPDAEWNALSEKVKGYNQRLNAFNNGPPHAPFKTTWHELALRRLLRHAAENGFDRLTWTTGEQQAARYDLSKQVESVSYQAESEQYHITAVDPQGAEHVLGSFGKADLPDAVGKELAQKIIDGQGAENGQFKKLSGLDLKVGGEGMKGFYDKMVPDFLRQFGKKFDARTEDVQLDNGETVHSIQITDAMRDSLLHDGTALFQGEKGAVSFLRDGRAVIHALDNPDFSTSAHELAHVFARTLTGPEKYQFEKWLLGNSRMTRDWNTADHEAFARGFETYLAEGKAPTPALQAVFDKFKTWLVEIYRNIIGSPLEKKLHADAAKAFDRMLFDETMHKEVSPEVQAIHAANQEHAAELTAELHDLAGLEQSPPVSSSLIPHPSSDSPAPPARIARELALHTYDAPDTISRFAADPGNVPPVLAEMFRAEGAIIATAKPTAQGKTLLEFARERGINDDGGDLAAMDIDKGIKKGQQKLLRPDGMGLDRVREAAVEQGYLPEGSTINDLLDRIDAEKRGAPTYAHSGEDSHTPEWFQAVARASRRTGKEQGDPAAVAAALEKAAAGGFAKLPNRMQDYVLSALDHIDRLVQSSAQELDAQDLQVGDRYMTADMQHHTVTGERDGLLILDDGRTVRMDDVVKVVGDIDTSGRPPEKGYDPLDYTTEQLLTERGDFNVVQGTDAAGNVVMKSARELIDEGKNDLTVHENRKHLYDTAAACLGLEF